MFHSSAKYCDSGIINAIISSDAQFVNKRTTASDDLKSVLEQMQACPFQIFYIILINEATESGRKDS